MVKLSSDSSSYNATVEQIVAATRAEEATVTWAESEILKGRSRSAATCCNRKPTCEPYPKCCDCGFQPPIPEVRVENLVA